MLRRSRFLISRNNLKMKLLTRSCKIAIYSAGLFCLPTQMVIAQEALSLGQDGKTAYVIYHDASAPSSVKDAARDLKSYFQKVAGFSPEIRTDAVSPQTPYISLGDTVQARAAGLGAAAITPDGFRMAVRGKNLYIVGQDTLSGQLNEWGGISTGTANGIYTFCEDYLGVRWLAPGDLGEETPTRGIINVPVNLDRIEIPTFNYRQLPYIGKTGEVAAWSKRLKVGSNTQVVRLRHGHNWSVLPPSLYDKHPDWFAEINGKRQIPTGRYKFETTNPALVQAFADKVIEEFRADPNLKSFSLSPSDGGGFSESAASKALYDQAPNGELSLTPLVLKFYNDVAKIVGKEFPDRKLGGYIYSNYTHPPSNGVAHIEPNLAFVVAGGTTAGYVLYRDDMQQSWERVIRFWGETARKSGSDIYSYDLPATLKQNMGVITPPAPELLNFIFSRLDKYGYKGEYIYGTDSWEQAGPGNYAKAKLLWNPKLDAAELCREYYRAAYGAEAAVPIERMYDLLDREFAEFFRRNLDASYNLTPEFLREIYAPHYGEIDSLFLQAQAVVQSDKQRKRLRQLGQVISILQWNLKASGMLPQNLQTPLTLDDEGVDRAVRELKWSGSGGEMKNETTKYRTQLISVPVTGAVAPASIVPTRSDMRMLLHSTGDGEISIVSKTLNTQGELAFYSLYDAADNKLLKTGVIRAGREIRFPAPTGKTYRFDVNNVWSSMRFEVQGGVTAYKTNALHRGFRINGHELSDARTPLGFEVPAGMKGFNVTINGANIVADVIAPDGKNMGTIDTSQTPIARIQVPENASSEGYWKLVLHKPKEPIAVFYIVLDEKLPQWIFPNPAQALEISSVN
jgi:hypothetical protein